MEKSLYYDENIEEIKLTPRDDLLDIDEDKAMEFNSVGPHSEIEEIEFGEADSVEEYYPEETDEKESKPKNKYITKNGKELAKTKTRYVYKIIGGPGYVYRLYCKEPKIDKWVMNNPDADSVRKQPFRTEKEAEEHMFRALHEHKTRKSGELVKKTFGEVWEDFLNSDHNKAAETIRRYGSIYRNHVKAAFGNRIISSIPIGDINDFLAEKYRQDSTSETEGLSYAYLKSIMKFFYLVFVYARKHNNITSAILNDFEQLIEMPEKRKEKDDLNIRILTEEQIKKIAELLKPTDYYLPFLIAITTGLRPAETFCLTFSDINFKEKTITVNKQVVVESTGLRCIKKPKTNNSYRTLPCPDIVLEEVKRRKERCDACDPRVFNNNKKMFVDMTKSIDGKNIPQPDFINVDSKGTFIEPHSFSYWSKQIQKTICPPEDGVEAFSFYTFRKTNLSYICSVLSLHGAMYHAGHSKTDTLMKHYYHSTPILEEKELEVAENIVAIFNTQE